jgi:hypothetical protein
MLSRTVPFKIQCCWGTYTTNWSVVKIPFKHCPPNPALYPVILIHIFLLIGVQEIRCKVSTYGIHISLIHMQGVYIFALFPNPFPTSRFVYVKNWV